MAEVRNQHILSHQNDALAKKLFIGPEGNSFKDPTKYYNTVTTLYSVGVGFRVPALVQWTVKMMTQSVDEVVNCVNEQKRANNAVNIGQEVARGIVDGAKRAFDGGLNDQNEMQAAYLLLATKTNLAIFKDEHIKEYLEEVPLWSVAILQATI
jgi:hypothetical protein